MNAPATVLQKKIALCMLIPATVLFLASLFPAGMMILFSPMAFDAGPQPGLWVLVITLLAYPVVVLMTIIATWISFARHAYRLAMWLNVLPIIHLIVLVAETAITG